MESISSSWSAHVPTRGCAHVRTRPGAHAPRAYPNLRPRPMLGAKPHAVTAAARVRELQRFQNDAHPRRQAPSDIPSMTVPPLALALAARPVRRELRPVADVGRDEVCDRGVGDPRVHPGEAGLGATVA